MTVQERIEFIAGDVRLVGDLRVPAAAAGAGPGARYPALALTGPFTGVRDQVTGRYAGALADAGYVTLAFDHRGFGASGGRPDHEDTQGKLGDLLAAVDVLVGHPAVHPDRIALVGVCLGGGYAVAAAARDPRVRAVAGVAGAYNSPAWFAGQMGVATYRAALRSFLAGYDEVLPAVAPDGGEAAMGGDEPYAYYGTGRSASATWRNQVTRGSLHSLMTFDALAAAPLLADTPLLVVHGRADDYCSPDLAREMVRRTPGVADLVELGCDRHIDLYDVEPHVSDAVAAVDRFLVRHLPSD